MFSWVLVVFITLITGTKTVLAGTGNVICSVGSTIGGWFGL